MNISLGAMIVMSDIKRLIEDIKSAIDRLEEYGERPSRVFINIKSEKDAIEYHKQFSGVETIKTVWGVPLVFNDLDDNINFYVEG